MQSLGRSVFAFERCANRDRRAANGCPLEQRGRPFFPTISSEVMQGDLVGLANLLTEEIDGNQRCYQELRLSTPATNLAARKSEIVKCRIPSMIAT